MVIRSAQVYHLLDQKREAFAAFDLNITEKRQLYRQAMAQLCTWSSLEIAEQLSQMSAPGALATAEWDLYRSWCVPFPYQWSNQQESLEWVNPTIQNVPTFAVDGSQLYLDKEISLPIALVQIGWYENHHCQEGRFEKDIALDIMTPKDLGASNSGEPRAQVINLRRTQMEIERLVQYLGSAETSSLAFFDGALVATFAEPFEPDVQDRYVQAILELLRTSETERAPLVAYIDTTYTRDLTHMLQHLFHLPEAPQIHDAQLLEGQLSWGERTPLFICARSGTQQGHQGILTSYQEMRDRIGFVYLKTHDTFPVRLEFPLWIAEANLLDWVIDIVRCEVIIGKGYPYVIETADQVALLRAEDRHSFIRVLQDWSQRENLPLRLSRKTISKMQRRRIR